MKKILVTGGAGFIGTNLLYFILERSKKSEIVVLDNFHNAISNDIHNHPRVRVIKGDVRVLTDIKKSLKGVDACVHLAAATDVRKSIKNPGQHIEENVMGALNVLNTCKDYNIKRIVFASSNATLGVQSPPITESMVPKPISPYGVSKLFGEMMADVFNDLYGMSIISLRFSNVYGLYSENKTSVITTFIKNILQQKPIIVYGNGKQTRDFIYVQDICNAIYLSIKNPSAKGVLQIASGKEISIIDLLKMLKTITGREIKLEYHLARKGEIKRNYSKIIKARRVLSYRPSVDLYDGLIKTYYYFLKYFK